VPLYKTTVR